MNLGKIVIVLLLACAVFAGAGLYYLQVYHFYDEVSEGEVQLVSLVTDVPETIQFEGFAAIDGTSSPIRYRACFTTQMSLAMLSETYKPVERPEPRVAPGWFDCFDAEAIAAELEAGTALAFMSLPHVAVGVDRIVAITDDGRGYAWHEPNECGTKAYDGTLRKSDCPNGTDAAQGGN